MVDYVSLSELTKSDLSVFRRKQSKRRDGERARETMEEEEHEVYGGEIPDVGEMDGDMEALNPDLDMAAADDDAVKVYYYLFLSYCFAHLYVTELD